MAHGPVYWYAWFRQPCQPGYLAPEKVQRLVDGVREAGIAVLERCIPQSDLDYLALRMDFDAAHQAVTAKWKERGGFGSTEAHDGLVGGHAQQGLPRTGASSAPLPHPGPDHHALQWHHLASPPPAAGGPPAASRPQGAVAVVWLSE